MRPYSSAVILFTFQGPVRLQSWLPSTLGFGWFSCGLNGTFQGVAGELVAVALREAI